MSVVLGIIRINALSVVARYVIFPSPLLFLYEDKVVAGWKKAGGIFCGGEMGERSINKD